MFRLLTLFTLIAALCAGGMVYGQDELGTRQETQGITTREPTTTPLAQAPPDEPKTFKIASQALDGALIEFSAVTGIQVLVEGELTAGVASPGVSGSLPPEQALQRLLGNSDLTYRFTNANTVTLEQARPDAGQAPITLPAITVTAAAESAFGPVDGYVANRGATATKTDTPIIQTPQSISVVTRDRMEAQNAQSVSDALRYTAGVVAESNGPDPREDRVILRGIETFSSGPQYRDGLRDFAFNGQGGIVMEPYGLERIEVLRGPASVLYGQGTPGGLINLITKLPTQIPLYEIQLQYGSFDRKQAAFDLSGPIDDEGRFLYRLTGLARDADSQIDFVTDDRVYFAPALTWQPSNATSLRLLASYQKNERGQGYQALPRVGTLVPGRNGFIATDRFVGEPGFDRFDQERTSLGYEFEHHLNSAWSLRQNFRWMAQETLHNTIFFPACKMTARQSIAES